MKKQANKKVVLDVWARNWKSCVQDIRSDLKTFGLWDFDIELFNTKQNLLDHCKQNRPKHIPKHLKITIEEI